MEGYDSLRRGDGIWVRYGATGRQYAIVYGRSPHRCWVVKWRANSRRWTGRVTLFRGDFLYRAEIGGGDRVAPPTTPIPQDIWSGKR